MNKMIFCRYATLASLMIFVGLTASANVVWHNGETVTVAADITDNIDLEGTVYVRVTGGTRSLTGVISEVPGKVGRLIVLGPSKLQIRKEGTGPGRNAPPNEFSGGIELRDGTLSTYGSASSTGPAEANCPYGTGDIVVDNSDPTKKPMLDWMGTVINNITVEASTSFDKPFLSRGGGTGCFGDILIKGDGHVIAYTTRPDGTMNNSKMAINKSITLRTEDGVKHDLYYNGSTIYNLQCFVVAHVMDAAQRFDSKGNQICCSQYPGMIGGFWLGPSFKDSDVDLIRINQGWLVCAGDGVANGTFAVEFYGGLPTQLYLTKSYGSSWEVGKEVDAGRFVLNYEGTKGVPTTTVWTQTIKWLDTDYRDDTEPNYIITRQNGGYPFEAKLRFTGEPNRTACAYMAVKDKIAIELDAPKTFTQIFSNRTHNITRPITVKGGTLEFANCRFTNIDTYSVQGGGTLRFRDGDAPALPTNLSVDGSLEMYGQGSAPQMPDTIVVSNGVFLMQGFDRITNRITSVELSGENASLSFPKGSTLTVNSYIVDGVMQRDGDYVLDGVTIQARGGVFPTTATAVWVGEGADNDFKTAANWEYGELPTFDETLNAIISKSGNEVKVREDVTVGALQITNAGPIEATYPILLEGRTRGKPEETKLTVYGQMNLLFDRAQLTLKDITIATPYGYDQGAPTRLGDKTFTILTTNRSDWALVPITLHNAIIEKPVYMRTAADGENKASVLMSVVAGSVNEFKGKCWKEQANWADISMQPGSMLTFSGGFESGYKWNLRMADDATFIIRNKPWHSTSSGNACFNIYGGHVIFDAVGNYFGYNSGTNTYQDGLNVSVSSNPGQMTTIDLTQNYALKSSRIRTTSSNISGIMFDFHNTTNGTRCLRSDNNVHTDTNETLRSYFTGEVGSMLHIDNEDRVHTTSYTYFHFRGGIGILKTGAGIFTLQRTALRKSLGLNNDHTSTGPLVVQQGTLKLDEGVTWRHCSSVDLTGGVLQVTENMALGREATLNLTGGKISVPSGKTLCFSSAVINGVPVQDGDYTKSTVGNPFADYMTGDCEGTIRICQRGFLLIYR